LKSKESGYENQERGIGLQDFGDKTQEPRKYLETGVVQRSNSLERIKSMVLSTENGKRLSHYQDSDNDNPYS
jgi:hypothetical protein